MPAKKTTLKVRVDELETLVDRLKGKRDQAIINIVRGQDLTDADVNELKEEQAKTTDNMVELHDQVMSMIKIAEDLKRESALYRTFPKTPIGLDLQAMVSEYLKERTAKRLAAFFTGLGQTTSILLLGALGATAIKLVVFGL